MVNNFKSGPGLRSPDLNQNIQIRREQTLKASISEFSEVLQDLSRTKKFFDLFFWFVRTACEFRIEFFDLKIQIEPFTDCKSSSVKNPPAKIPSRFWNLEQSQIHRVHAACSR